MNMVRVAVVVLLSAFGIACGDDGSAQANGQGGSAGSAGASSGNGGTGKGGASGSGGSTAGGSSGSAGSGGSDDPCPGEPVSCNGACLEPGGTQGNCTVLAQASGQILDIAVDGEHVYMATVNGVERVPRAGGPVEVLVETADFAEAIAVNSTSIFWSVGGFSSSTLMTRPKSSGTPMQLDSHSDTIRPIRVNETRVFYLKESFASGSAVSSAAVTGGTQLTHGSSDSASDSLAIDDTHVYWADNPFSEDSNLSRSPQDMAAAEQLTIFDTVYYPIPHDSDVYFHESLANGLHRVPKTGGTPTLVLTLPSIREFNPRMFANATHFFWLSSTGVMRVGFDGANPESVVEFEVAYAALADATHLFLVQLENLVAVTL